MVGMEFLVRFFRKSPDWKRASIGPRHLVSRPDGKLVPRTAQLSSPLRLSRLLGELAVQSESP